MVLWLHWYILWLLGRVWICNPTHPFGYCLHTVPFMKRHKTFIPSVLAPCFFFIAGNFTFLHSTKSIHKKWLNYFFVSFFKGMNDLVWLTMFPLFTVGIFWNLHFQKRIYAKEIKREYTSFRTELWNPWCLLSLAVCLRCFINQS